MWILFGIFLIIGAACVTVGMVLARQAQDLPSNHLADLRPSRPGLWTRWLVMSRNGLRLRALALLLFGVLVPLNFGLLVFAPQAQPNALYGSGGVWALVVVAMGVEQMRAASRYPRP